MTDIENILERVLIFEPWIPILVTFQAGSVNTYLKVSKDHSCYYNTEHAKYPMKALLPNDLIKTLFFHTKNKKEFYAMLRRSADEAYNHVEIWTLQHTESFLDSLSLWMVLKLSRNGFQGIYKFKYSFALLCFYSCKYTSKVRAFQPHSL